MKNKRFISYILDVVNLALLFTILVGLPFAWIIHDGLGPDMKATTGFVALIKTFQTYNIGITIIVLFTLKIYLHRIGK